MKEITLQKMLSTIIGELRENGKWGTAHIYQTTLNVFSTFNNYQNLPFRKLTPALLKQFEVYLRQRDCSWNTVSTYMKTLRSCYNRAVDLRYAHYVPRLFEHVYTGTRADKKRALEASDMGGLIRGAKKRFVKKHITFKFAEDQNAVCPYVLIAWTSFCRFGLFTQKGFARKCFGLPAPQNRTHINCSSIF